MGKKETKTTELVGYYVSGDYECACFASHINDCGIAKGHKVYLGDLIPDKIEDENMYYKNMKKYNIKITVEVEQIE